MLLLASRGYTHRTSRCEQKQGLLMLFIPEVADKPAHHSSPSNQINAQKYLKYITGSYPSNHTYDIIQNKLIPKTKLATRYKKLQKLFPKKLESLVDIGCSKGFFVFEGGNHPHCTRSLGIDVNPYDIEICHWVNQTIKNDRVDFKLLKLHELADNIDQFGGAFQTVLVINIYQYLYFGSDTFPDNYLDHDTIFKNLRKICSERIIFNNRINLKDCQNTQRIENVDKKWVENYSEKNVMEAASRYFTLKKYGSIGKYPLWLLEVKP
jgi:hypothetical protein